MSVAEFTFMGFVPHKKGRQQFFTKVSESTAPTAFYESPHRIIKTIESLKEILVAERQVVIGRELTKIYEEIVRGDMGAVYEYFQKNPDKVRGEFVMIVGGQ
jgi:16S rRNA (cytidine1402-2'-O)-methyltransferase